MVQHVSTEYVGVGSLWSWYNTWVLCMLGLGVSLIMVQHVSTVYVGVRGLSDHSTTREYWICWGWGLLWSWTTREYWICWGWGVTLILAQHVSTEYVGDRGLSDHGTTREYWICLGYGLLWSWHNTWIPCMFGLGVRGYSDHDTTREYWICWGYGLLWSSHNTWLG